MNIEEIYERIKTNQPKLIYISGKTSTGKSTFTKRLTNDFDYKLIELDQIVLEAVIKPLKLPDEGSVFVEVYRNRDKKEWIELFVQATRDLIKKYAQNSESLIIEGAVANPNTLQEIFDGYPKLSFIYFHPKTLDNYVRNLTNRFMVTNKLDRVGLPSAFWNLIDKSEFKQFCENRILTGSLSNAIRKYALLSQEESEKRLLLFKNYFENIEVVEV